jgi:hypothetical protein
LGEWKHDVKSGHGRLIAAGNEFVYNGDFKNDAMHGDGRWENAEEGYFHIVTLSCTATRSLTSGNIMLEQGSCTRASLRMANGMVEESTQTHLG